MYKRQLDDDEPKSPSEKQAGELAFSFSPL